MADFILSIDEGTTGVQASFFSIDDLSMYGNNKVEFRQIYPTPGLVEHDLDDVWKATLAAIQQAIQKAQSQCSTFHLNKVAGIGITNQRETVAAWNKVTGELAGNALVWQDRRTADFCQTLKQDEQKRISILKKTGLVCDPYFSASKMKWMQEHYPKAKQWAAASELVFGTIDSYVIWKLTNGKSFATDHTNASRTMLYHLEQGQYDQELLDLFGIKQQTLPEIRPSIGPFGKTQGLGMLPDGIPILGVLGDQQSALFGQGCTKPGQAKITFGTGAFLLMNTGEHHTCSHEGLLTTVAYSTKQKRTFALEGSAFVAGAAVQFLRDNFQWFQQSFQSEALATALPRDENLLFVPSLAGLGAPHWNPHAKGVLFGLTRGSQKGQIIRAVLESIALQNVGLLRLMEQVSTQPLDLIGIDGGGSKNDFLMQFQSDVLGTKLLRPKNIETTSLGAARAARLALLEKDTDQEEIMVEKQFLPTMPKQDADRLVSAWAKAVDCVNGFYQV